MRPIRVIGLLVAAWILGGATPQVEARGSLKVTFTTSPAPTKQFAPNIAVVGWVQTQAGTFVKTVGQWVEIRQAALVAWRQIAGTTDIDAVSGASQNPDTKTLSLVWNLRDRQGNVVPDGTYTIRLELAESNATTVADNNEGTFTFVKGATPQTQTNLTSGGFTNVTIEFDPNAVTCNDGTVDAPEEKCDPAIRVDMPGACPTVCPTVDACMPQQLQGDATRCSAECVAAAPITTCVDGDGCCAPGCTEANDSDCVGGGPPVASGGCETSGSGAGGALAFAALGLGLLIRRRRR
jgi:uncharacterized protein (TIGR03382 family)